MTGEGPEERHRDLEAGAPRGRAKARLERFGPGVRTIATASCTAGALLMGVAVTALGRPIGG